MDGSTVNPEQDGIEHQHVDNDLKGRDINSSTSSFDEIEVLSHELHNLEGKYENEELEVEEGAEEEIQIGVLDEESVGQGLYNLGRSASGSQNLFLNLSLHELDLIDISILRDYVHLQVVSLAHNQISDLSVFSHTPHLIHLDVSHNQVSELLDFEPPRNLKSVNLSYNLIKAMTDLSEHHYLQKLVLNNNQITQINGISNCHRLAYLNLANNTLSEMTGLENLPIKYLDVSGNFLHRIENIGTLRILQHINLSGNQIRSLRGLEGHSFLESIDMEDNEIIDQSEIQFVAELPLLRQLNLTRNPVRELPDYRLAAIFQLQKLHELDCQPVDIKEKVCSTNVFNPQIEVIAARDHIMQVVYSCLQPARVLDSTLPSVETPYPMLVLVGPQGAGKKNLAVKLVDEFPDYFGYGMSHTTCKPRPEAGEETDQDYHFVTTEEFENNVKMGKFLQTYSCHGNQYGLSTEAVESSAREGLACVLHMEIEGMLTLKNTHFEPRYVLLLPLNRESHERRLREAGVQDEMQMEWTLNRAELYAAYNRDNPGFFDMFINSDDITVAYRKLRRLVMDYLGMSSPASSSTDTADQSRAGSQQLEKETTSDTLGSSRPVDDTCSYSKRSLSEMMPTGLRVNQSPLPHSSRGAVEAASLRRRASAAKQAVTGAHPSLYEQILQKAPRTVPQPVTEQLELGDPTVPSRALSAPVHYLAAMDTLPPSSSDSSAMGVDQSSGLTNISEARDVNATNSPADFRQGSHAPILAVDSLVLPSYPSLSNQWPLEVGLQREPEHPPSMYAMTDILQCSSEQLSFVSDALPGSSHHIVLPPIQPSTEDIFAT